MSDCLYCGTSNASAGNHCSKSPTKGHVVESGAKKCVYCGTSNASVGGHCTKSPTKGHALKILL